MDQAADVLVYLVSFASSVKADLPRARGRSVLRRSWCGVRRNGNGASEANWTYLATG